MADNLYDDGHLFVAAVRVLGHRLGRPPTSAAVAELLDRTPEWAALLARRLVKAGVIQEVADPFGAALFVADHLALEALIEADNEEEGGLAAELERFQAQRQGSASRVAAAQAEAEARRRDLFAELEAKLRAGVGPKDQGD